MPFLRHEKRPRPRLRLQAYLLEAQPPRAIGVGKVKPFAVRAGAGALKLRQELVIDAVRRQPGQRVAVVAAAVGPRLGDVVAAPAGAPMGARNHPVDQLRSEGRRRGEGVVDQGEEAVEGEEEDDGFATERRGAAPAIFCRRRRRGRKGLFVLIVEGMGFLCLRKGGVAGHGFLGGLSLYFERRRAGRNGDERSGNWSE